MTEEIHLIKKENTQRKLDPSDILLPSGYKIDVFADGLTTPINLTFTDTGEMLIADSGITDGNGKVLKLTREGFTVIADGFNPPLTGITEYQGNIYVAHRRYVTIIQPNGMKTDIIEGLPSNGDHHNNRVVFGPDGKMYFGQGTATNSGVVGKDNDWVKEHPFFHDYPGGEITLNGQGFETPGFLASFQNRDVTTGAYVPFGVSSYPGKTVDGLIRASGSILRANPDGSELELVAWGLRNRSDYDSTATIVCLQQIMGLMCVAADQLPTRQMNFSGFVLVFGMVFQTSLGDSLSPCRSSNQNWDHSHPFCWWNILCNPHIR